MINLQNLLLRLWLCIPALLFSVFLSFSSQAVDCSATTVGLCDEVVDQVIVETITETVEQKPDGILTTTTTVTDTTTTTVTNEDSGDILDGDNNYVTSSKEGDMDYDWGGEGPASMPTGTYCGDLGTDRCAEITGGSDGISRMGVTGMGSTFYQVVDISELDIKYGGRTNYSIKVDKQDAQDRIYMHITGRDGTTEVFSGTDILSESGVNSGYQVYESGFDFAGTITNLIIEVGGRDVNLAVGPVFDDISIRVLYNTINTIVTQSIESVEMFVALNVDATVEEINIVENIFDNNTIMETPTGEIDIQPIEEPDTEVSYEMVEMEMEIEMPVMEVEIPEMKMEMPEIEVTSVETEIEAEMEMEMEMPEPEVNEPDPQPEEVQNEPTEEDTTEPEPETQEEPKQEESAPEAIENETEEVEAEEVEEKEEPKKEESKKEVAAKKILEKMGDKGRYDSANQLKTLIVMQVLGNSKSFFDSQKQLNDIEGFFTDQFIPDAELTTNNIAQYFLFAGSDGLMNEMVMQQWQN